MYTALKRRESIQFSVHGIAKTIFIGHSLKAEITYRVIFIHVYIAITIFSKDQPITFMCQLHDLTSINVTMMDSKDILTVLKH